MHLEQEQLEREILEIIKRHNLFNISDIFAYYKGCNRTTFYNRGLNKLDTIKDAITENRQLTAHSLKATWAKSSNPTLQLALFKTICTDEERKALSMQYNEVKNLDIVVSIDGEDDDD